MGLHLFFLRTRTLVIAGSVLLAVSAYAFSADETPKAAPQRTQSKKSDNSNNNKDGKSGTSEKPQQATPKGNKTAESNSAKAKKPVQPNLLQQWIRKVLRPGNANQTPAAGNQNLPSNSANESESSGRDHIDLLAPQETSLTSDLRRIKMAVNQGDFNRALKRIEVLLHSRSPDRPLPHERVYRGPNGKWVTVLQEVNRILGQFPAEPLEFHRRRYSGQASQILEYARETGELAKYVEVADYYLQTDAGAEAANYLGSLHFDRGEFGLAAQWFERLLDTNARLIGDRRWRLKVAFAFRLAGRVETAEQLLKDLSGTSPDAGVDLAKLSAQLQRWLARSEAFEDLTQPVLDNWPLLYGTPARMGTVTGGQPLLLERWTYPMTLSQPIQQQIGSLMEDLADRGRAAIPAFVPLTVDGKAVFRTLRGVSVVDVASGKELWSTREGVSAERLLNRGQLQQVGARSVWRFGGLGRVRSSSYSGRSADSHPLTSLLFRNGTYGVISSDGRQLFVLEDHAVLANRQPGYLSRLSRTFSDPYRRDWSSNKLASYDLSSGRPLWSIGGAAMH